ncbi:MAG TPA: MFS transporter [Candidatus Saccharimonadia bacterium]
MKKRSALGIDIDDAVSVARNSNFNRLWGSQILSQVAQNLLNFALIIRVFQLAQGTRFANISVALLILSYGIPSVIFAAAAGVFVDHWNRRNVLYIVNFLRAVLVLGYILFDHQLWVVLLLSFVISTTTQFFVPAESAAIPSLVSQRQLLRANALFIFTLYASFIVGYSAAAPALASLGLNGPYYLTAIMFALAGLLDWFLPNMQPEKVIGKISASRLVRYTVKEVNDNWKLIRTNHNLAFPMTQLIIAQAMLSVILALAPALSFALLGLPIEQSSHYLIIPAGLGLIAGVVAVDRLVKIWGRTRIIALGMLTAAVGLVLTGMLGRLHAPVHGHYLLTSDQVGMLVAVLAFALGMLNAMISVAAQTVLQENSSESSRGKVFGALTMLINVAATLPVLFAGVLADFTSVTKVMIALGLMLFVFASWQVWQLQQAGRLKRPVRA